ncbi:MAG TPA: hypothetical protein VKV06_16110 [Acidimicrobiales bacterium]|nr:hypothetical protein [Acidimicrobiales bacterium]
MSDQTLSVVSFGWEITNLHDNGADVYFPVQRDMIFQWLDVDVATMLTSLPSSAGFLEVLCTGAVGRGGPPKFGPAPQAYLETPDSTNFGSIATENPEGLSVGIGPTTPGQDGFFATILKAFAPSTGAASSASRHVHTEPDLVLRRGDYLGFHMDHAGVQVDGEMQVVIGYARL